MEKPSPEVVMVEGAWTFLSNHGHVLLCIAAEPEIRLRDVATRVGITERAVQRIVADLEAGHYLTRERIGRRNRYQVHVERPLRHPVEAHQEIRKLLDLLPPPARVAPPNDGGGTEGSAAEVGARVISGE